MPPVYLNGQLVDAADATVSVFDHGLLTGDGIFESIAIRNGRPFALRRHLARLARSATLIGLEIPPADDLAEAAELVSSAAGFDSGKLRITVTAGPGPLGSARGRSAPTVIVACEELSGEVGTASVVLAPWPKSERAPTAGAKTISYADNVAALSFALARGASEALFSNLEGNLCEGTGSNVFVGLGAALATPPLSSGCLAGVTRALILGVTDAVERDIALAELESADEVFLSSTTRGVQPVESIDGRELAACPGPLTQAASVGFEALTARGEP